MIAPQISKSQYGAGIEFGMRQNIINITVLADSFNLKFVNNLNCNVRNFCFDNRTHAPETQERTFYKKIEQSTKMEIEF